MFRSSCDVYLMIMVGVVIGGNVPYVSDSLAPFKSNGGDLIICTSSSIIAIIS